MLSNAVRLRCLRRGLADAAAALVFLASRAVAQGQQLPAYNLAIRFTCENEWAAEAEFALGIGHLEYLKTGQPSSSMEPSNPEGIRETKRDVIEVCDFVARSLESQQIHRCL
jgi:hypothetical protein